MRQVTWSVLAMSVLFHAGCGGRSYIVLDRPMDPVEYESTIQIGEIEDLVPGREFDKHPTAEATQSLRGALADWLEKEGVSDRVDVDIRGTDRTDYVVTGKILSYEAPKETPAYLQVLSFLVYGWFGPSGTRDGSLWVNLALRDRETDRIVYSGIFLGRTRNPISVVAKDFAKELKHRAAVLPPE